VRYDGRLWCASYKSCLLSLENVAAKEKALFTGKIDPLAPSVMLIGIQSLKTRQTFDSIRRDELRFTRELGEVSRVV
jgi:hypothetical protein